MESKKYFQVPVRMQKPRDADLISLYCLWGAEFIPAMRDAVRAYVRGERYSVQVPERAEPGEGDIRVTLTFIAGKDDDVIAFIRNIKGKSRGTVVKMILRDSLTDIYIEPFLINAAAVPDAERTAGPGTVHDPARKPATSPKSGGGNIPEGSHAGTGISGGGTPHESRQDNKAAQHANKVCAEEDGQDETTRPGEGPGVDALLDFFDNLGG